MSLEQHTTRSVLFSAFVTKRFLAFSSIHWLCVVFFSGVLNVACIPVSLAVAVFVQKRNF